VIPEPEGGPEVAVEQSAHPSLAWTPTADYVGFFLRLGYAPIARAGDRGPTIFS
jgi:hypothetical protein